MAGIRLVVARPVPPAPFGTAYITDGQGRVLVGNGLLTANAEPPPVGFSFATDEDDATLADEGGVEFLLENT